MSQLERFDDGADIDVQQLSSAGLIDNTKSKVKILGDGDISHPLTVKVQKVTSAAKTKIEAAGGSVEEVTVASEAD